MLRDNHLMPPLCYASTTRTPARPLAAYASAPAAATTATALCVAP